MPPPPQVTVASVEDGGLTVTCSRQVKIVADCGIADCAGQQYDLIALPRVPQQRCIHHRSIGSSNLTESEDHPPEHHGHLHGNGTALNGTAAAALNATAAAAVNATANATRALLQQAWR